MPGTSVVATAKQRIRHSIRVGLWAAAAARSAQAPSRARDTDHRPRPKVRDRLPLPDRETSARTTLMPADARDDEQKRQKPVRGRRNDREAAVQRRQAIAAEPGAMRPASLSACLRCRFYRTRGSDRSWSWRRWTDDAGTPATPRSRRPRPKPGSHALPGADDHVRRARPEDLAARVASDQ